MKRQIVLAGGAPARRRMAGWFRGIAALAVVGLVLAACSSSAAVNGATGVLESSKLASGRNESWRSLDYVEVNGSQRSFVFVTGEWNKLQTGEAGGPGMETVEIPSDFWKWPGSPRDPTRGDPLLTFRYDQAWEFVDAIRNERPCVPSFHDGARALAVMDAAVKSAQTRLWVEPENQN